MINCKIYINKRRLVDYDDFTASFDDGHTYIWDFGEFDFFNACYDTFLNLPNDSENKFTTYQNGKFIFIDCRRTLKDITQ